MSPLIKDYPDPEIVLNLQKLMPSRVINERDRLEYPVFYFVLSSFVA